MGAPAETDPYEVSRGLRDLEDYLTPKKPKIVVRYSSDREIEGRSTPMSMAEAQLSFQRRQDEDARKAEQQRKKARSDFANYQRQYGSDFDRVALEEYNETYKTDGYDLVRSEPYGDEMKKLLRKHLGL